MPSTPARPETPEPSIRVLAAVVRRGDQYLICQRPPHKRHGGLWEFPGGKIEQGESLEEAARRELREELRVEVARTGALLFSRHDPGSPFVIEFLEVEIQGEPDAIEHAAVEWKALSELPVMALAPSDAAFVDWLVSVTDRH